MQPNIAMKFAVYVVRILLCKHCKFGEQACYNIRDIEFFLGDYFFGASCIFSTSYFCKKKTKLTDDITAA